MVEGIILLILTFSQSSSDQMVAEAPEERERRAWLCKCLTLRISVLMP